MTKILIKKIYTIVVEGFLCLFTMIVFIIIRSTQRQFDI